VKLIQESNLSSNQSNQIFVYCLNVKNKTIYKVLIIAVTDAGMIYRQKAPTINLFYFAISKDQ